MGISSRSNNAPSASELTSSPLRNCIRVELSAPISEVWALISDLARFPEYSSGLERVDAKVDSSGRCTEYVCHFKPPEADGVRIVSREVIRWWEPNRGYASSGAESDVFGLTNDLHRVVVEPSEEGAVVTLDE